MVEQKDHMETITFAKQLQIKSAKYHSTEIPRIVTNSITGFQNFCKREADRGKTKVTSTINPYTCRAYTKK